MLPYTQLYTKRLQQSSVYMMPMRSYLIPVTKHNPQHSALYQGSFPNPNLWSLQAEQVMYCLSKVWGSLSTSNIVQQKLQHFNVSQNTNQNTDLIAEPHIVYLASRIWPTILDLLLVFGTGSVLFHHVSSLSVLYNQYDIVWGLIPYTQLPRHPWICLLWFMASSSLSHLLLRHGCWVHGISPIHI